MQFTKLKEKIKTGLVWSQRYTKTDMVYLFKNGSIVSLGQFMATLVGLVVSITFAHFFPKEAYGNYRYILSIVAIFAITKLPGMNTAFARSVAQNYEGSYLKVLKEKIKWSTLGAIGAGVTALYYYFNGNNLLAGSFGIVTLLIPLTDNFSIYTPLLSGRKDYTRLSLFTSLSTLINALAVIIFILFFPPNIPVLLAVSLATNLVLDLLWFYITLKKYPPNHRVDLQTIPYGKYLSKIEIFNTITGQLDKIIVFQFLGSAELAIYVYALILPEHIKGYIKNITWLASPKIAQQNIPDHTGIFRHALRLSIASLIPCLGYILLAPFVYNFFYPQYYTAIQYSQFFSLSLIVVGPISLLYTFLESHAVKKELSKYNIYENFFSLIVLLIGIGWWGIWGAIGSRVLIRFFDLTFLIYLVKKAGSRA